MKRAVLAAMAATLIDGCGSDDEPAVSERVTTEVTTTSSVTEEGQTPTSVKVGTQAIAEYCRAFAANKVTPQIQERSFFRGAAFVARLKADPAGPYGDAARKLLAKYPDCPGQQTLQMRAIVKP
jgi:hypothetical protein